MKRLRDNARAHVTRPHARRNARYALNVSMVVREGFRELARRDAAIDAAYARAQRIANECDCEMVVFLDYDERNAKRPYVLSADDFDTHLYYYAIPQSDIIAAVLPCR